MVAAALAEAVAGEEEEAVEAAMAAAEAVGVDAAARAAAAARLAALREPARCDLPAISAVISPRFPPDQPAISA